MDLHSLPTYLQGKTINKEFGTKTFIYTAVFQEDLLFEKKNIYLSSLKLLWKNPSLTQMLTCKMFAFLLSTMSTVWDLHCCSKVNSASGITV